MKLAVFIAMNNTMINHEEMYYKIRTESARLAETFFLPYCDCTEHNSVFYYSRIEKI